MFMGFPVTFESPSPERMRYKCCLVASAMNAYGERNLLKMTTYAYDDANNRTRKSVTGEVDLLYLYGQGLNQIEMYFEDTDGSGTHEVGEPMTEFEYDLSGARVREESYDGTAVTLKVYDYDYEDRLIQLEISPSASEDRVTDQYRYGYDYRTRRAIRDESGAGGASTRVVFSEGVSVQEYENSSGSQIPADPTVQFIRGSDWGGGVGGILYSLRDAVPSFKFYNSRGDVVASTDGFGQLTFQAAYEAFGKHGDAPGSQEFIATGAVLDRQRANTKEEDPTGLLNEGFRYRDLETGTFITRDPLGFVDGPNVYTYVVQNPWTRWDPYGLKFDDNTFDSDKDQMRYYEDIEDKSRIDSDWFNGLGDTEEGRIAAYNSRVDNFNSELEKLNSTPFGSAQYDYLKSHKETFTLQFGYGRRGKGSDRSFVGGLTYTIAGMDSFGTQSHEFTHLIQNVANTGESSNGVSNNPALDFILSGIYSENEDWDDLIRGRRPLWREAQAMRAQNIVETEYRLITNPPGPLGIDGMTFSPYSLDPARARAYGSTFTLSPGLKNMGKTYYNDDAESENHRYNFNDAVGTRYDFSNAIQLSRQNQFDKNP